MTTQLVTGQVAGGVQVADGRENEQPLTWQKSITCLTLGIILSGVRRVSKDCVVHSWMPESWPRYCTNEDGYEEGTFILPYLIY